MSRILTFLLLAWWSGPLWAQPTVNTTTGPLPTVNTGPSSTTPGAGEPQVLNVQVGQPKDRSGYYFGRSPEDPNLVLTVYSPNVGLAEGRRLSLVWTEPRTYRCQLANSYVWVYVNQ